MPIAALLFGIAITTFALQATFIEWLIENALYVGIVLLSIWIIYSISTMLNIKSITGSLFVSLVCGLLHSVPPIFVLLSGYPYLLQYLEKATDQAGSSWGAVATFIELVIVGSFLFLFERIWYKLVIEDCSRLIGAFIPSLLHFLISLYFIYSFFTMQV